MSETDHQRIKAVFQRAVELKGRDRTAYLDEACAGNADLRREVESLLSHDETGEDAFEEQRLQAANRVIREAMDSREFVSTSGSRQPDLSAAPLPERIDRFRILRIIGEGGMGLVYEARQESPDRRVALKIIRPGLATKELLRRFRHEAEVLGQLQHPGIAHVYDAGIADVSFGDGPPVSRPWFAMEYIEGESLIEYARNHDLDVRDRLELMARVCDAVHYAHLKGIIHRDLKPANILVVAPTEHTDSGTVGATDVGQPKILDFGVARLTDTEVLTLSGQTDFGQLVGTIPYMSPEQVSGDNRGLDIRADVYALGVLTYELLAGQLPYDVRNHSIPAAARIISEEEPPSLSTANNTLGGDVETIVAKALEKERERRYQSAADLAADIRRFLRDEPIIARPATTFYQLRKFARRNRALTAAVAVIFVLLIAGIAVSSSQARRAKRAEIETRELYQQTLIAKEDAEAQRNEAQRQARIAKEVNAFLNDDILGAVDPYRTADPDITVREALDQAADQLEGRFTDAPLVEAAIRETLGETYMNLGQFETALNHLNRAIELLKSNRGEDDVETLVTESRLARLYQAWGRYDETGDVLKRIYPLLVEAAGPEAPETLAVMGGLGTLAFNQGRFADALRWREQVAEITRRTLGPDDPATLHAMSSLSTILSYLGRAEEAEAMERKVLAAREEALGEDHPATLTSKMNVAYMLSAKREFGLAEMMYQDVLEARRRTVGPEHPSTVIVMTNLGLLYLDSDRPAEAEEILRSAWEIGQRAFEPENTYLLTCLNFLAEANMDLGRQDKAEEYFRKAMDLMRAQDVVPKGNLASTLTTLSLLYLDQERFEEAEAMQLESVKLFKEALGPEHAYTLTAINNLGRGYLDREEWQKAVEVFEDMIADADLALPADDRKRTLYHAHYGEALIGLGRYEEAERELLLDADYVRKHVDPSSRRAVGLARLFVNLYESWNKPDKAAPWRELEAAESTDK